MFTGVYCFVLKNGLASPSIEAAVQGRCRGELHGQPLRKREMPPSLLAPKAMEGEVQPFAVCPVCCASL